MPSRRWQREIVRILPRAELITMVLLGMVRNAMNWFSFTWNGNLQEVWSLPGPEPSFTAKYHFDYWLKNVLSMVVLFRNLTTHLHLLFYIMMLYPLLTGEHPRLMLPWLYLQMAKNIVTDVICTVAGVLLCWTLHSCGLLTLEFLLVRIVSMTPSIYLWRRLRSYYFDLYYAELDGRNPFPVTKVKQGQGMTLAQRRRASKSLDGAMPLIASSDNRARFNSCVTYDEFFGPANWEANTEDKVSKSLTTLLTVESQESDDVGEDSSLQIIDGENLTPAEKTLKILGLSWEEVGAAASHVQKTTSTTDIGKSEALSLEPFTADGDLKSSHFSVTGETVERRAVGVQVRLPDFSKSITSSKEEKRTKVSKRCECCEETKCSNENDADSDDEKNQSSKNLQNSKARSVKEIPLDCCDRNRREKAKPGEIRNGNKKRDDDSSAGNLKTVSTTSGDCRNDVHLPKMGIKRVGIPWENLKEINFVSVINKALWNDTKLFNPSKDGEDAETSVKETLKNIFEESDRNINEIIPEHEDGTKFIRRFQRTSYSELSEFSGPTSASFGAESDILATNVSFVFEKNPNSDAQSIDSMVTTAKQLSQPDRDTEFNSYFKSSFQRHSDMFDETRVQLDPFRDDAYFSNYGITDRVNEDSQSYVIAGNPVRNKTDASFHSLYLYGSRCNARQHQPGSYEVQGIPEITESKGSENQRITSNLKASQASVIAITNPPFVDKKSSKMSRSSKNREMKEIQALRAYNEKTLLKYKKEMDARNREDRVRDEFPFYVPSVPELERPERELISNIEKAYARFARSKPVDPANGETLRGGSKAEDFFEIYNGNGRLKKDSRKNKFGEKTSARKQHLKYSKLSIGTKEPDAISQEFCKLAEGSQKGRELERIRAKENIRDAETVEVYFLERQVDDEPSTSKNLPVVTTVKDFSRKNDADLFSDVSSETLTSQDTRSPMVEVLNNPEEIPRRIEDSESYRQLRRNNFPNGVREAVRNIDWSFQRPNFVVTNRPREKRTNDTCAGVARVDESRDIVHKSTEHILQRVFANGENSARGFRLGETTDEFYPIFSTVSIAMEEIIRASALRGFTNEFTSQPSTEIETPGIDDGNLYGLANLPSEPRHRSSSGFVKCSILPRKKRSIQDKKGETDPLDQDESPSVEDEEASISLKEFRSGDVNIPVGKKTEDYTAKKRFFPSRRRSRELSFQIGKKTEEIISSERVRLALHDIIFQSPGCKAPNENDSGIEFSLASCRRILESFGTGGKELRSIVFEFFNQFPNYVTSNAQGFQMNLKANSDFVPRLQILTNLYAIQTKVGEIMNLSEAPPSSSTGSPSFRRNDQPQDQQTGTDFENVKRNHEDKKENTSDEKVAAEGGASFPDEFGNPRDDDRKLLSSLLVPDPATITDSELLNRANFRHQVISSGFSQAVKQSPSSFNSSEGTEAEMFEPKDEDGKAEKEVFAPDYERFLKMNLAEAEVLGLWITDDEESAKSRTVLVSPAVKEVSMVDSDDVIPIVVLQDIKTAECAIQRMKTIFEKFLTEGQSPGEKIGKRERLPDMKSKPSSSTNFGFPLNGELQKLQNLVQTIANYVTIARSSTSQSIKSSNEPTESDLRKKELDSCFRSESSEVSESLPKNGSKSNTDDRQPRFLSTQVSSSSKNPKVPKCTRDQLGDPSSWDKVIPLSTKRRIAKGNRKRRLGKVGAACEPARRLVKVVRLTEKKSVEFFGARSVPQRGRGLSSGYLMDSDSDGNFTVSRSPTPVSFESETSLTVSNENEHPGAFPKPLEIFAKSESRGTNQSVEVSCINVSETQNAACDEETHVLGAESLSTASDLQYMTSIDAAGIENKLKDVVQQILNHQFRGENLLINGFRIGLKNSSYSSISDHARTESSTDLQSKNQSPEDDVKEQQQTEDVYQKRIQELLHKSEEAFLQDLNAQYRNLNSTATSRNSDAISFEVMPRKSGVSVKSVAIGTEYNIEVFKDLLETFEKIHSIGEKSIPSQETSKSHRGCHNGNDTHDDEEDEREITEHHSRITSLEKMEGEVVSPLKKTYGIFTNSYDSFSSTFSKYKMDVPESSSRVMSLSNHTYFEEFPEQIDSNVVAMTPKICDTGSFTSRETIDYSFTNLDEKSDRVTPGSSQSNNESKKDASWKKKGIPRPIKSNKERK